MRIKCFFSFARDWRKPRTWPWTPRPSSRHFTDEEHGVLIVTDAAPAQVVEWVDR
jgi:hypothetical protein